MQATKQITLFLFLFVWSIARCYPTKPLNERSTELTWQAWLLIDESQNKQQDSTLKRRITPKSVFIAPTFSPESLPECSEGYQSDPMGRCIKIIMLNKELHLDFLLQQLNQKFGGMEDYEYEDEATSGPLNINIPLNAVQEETDVAIVVAPTKNIGQTTIETDINIDKTMKDEKVNVANIAGILGLKQVTEVETTTITGTETTTQEFTTETTTANTQASTSELNALFFLDEKRQVEVKTDSSTIASTTLSTGSTQDYTEKITTVKQGQDSDLTLYQMDQALPYAESSVSFVDIKRETEKFKNKFSMFEKTSERPNTAFTVRSTLIVPKKHSNTIFEPPLPKVSSPSPFKMPQQDATTPSMVFTPIDNMLSMEDTTSAAQTAGTVFNTKPESQFGLKIQNFFNRKKNASDDLAKHDEQDFVTAKIVSPPIGSYLEAKKRFRFPTSTQTVSPTSSSYLEAKRRVRFPTSTQIASSTTSQPSSSPSTTITYSSDISDRFAEQSRTTYSPINQNDTLKSISQINLAHTIPSQFNLTTLYERLKAQRDNHRNREKHSEWFHLPTKWSDEYNRTLIYRFSRKNGHMDTQELGPVNFFRQLDARAFGFKPTIRR